MMYREPFFRMLHECLHYIGDRKRTLRNDCLVRAVAEHIAMVIVAHEFNIDRINYYQENAVQFLDGDHKETIISMIAEECGRIVRETEERIAEEFYRQKLFAEYRDGHDNDDNHYRWAYLYEEYFNLDKVLEMLQKETDNKGTTFYGFLYNNVAIAQRRFIENIYDKLQDIYENCSDEYKTIYGRALAIYKLYYREEEYKKRNPNKRDKVLDDWLGAYFNFLIGNKCLYKTDWEFDYECDLTYEEIFDCIYEAMKESFSDCASIQMLDMALEDFVLSFIYELWDPKDAFPETIPSILRIGADLKVCYGVEGCLGSEAEKKIREKAQLRKNQGYRYKNVDETISAINGLLKEYSMDWCSRMRGQLEVYLNACIKDKSYWYSEPLGKLYRMCDFESADDINKMVAILIEEWRSLGENIHEGR